MAVPKSVFSLRAVLLIVAFIAYGMTALKYSTLGWMALTSVVLLNTIAIGAVLAGVSAGAKRVFWMGFVVSGLVNWIALCHGVKWLGIQADSRLTSQLRYWIHSSAEVMPDQWTFYSITVQLVSAVLAYSGGYVCFVVYERMRDDVER